MELFFANDLKFFDFSDVNDEHYLSADNFLSLHYTQPNILSKCKVPKECLPSKLCDKVFLLSSEISTVKHLMCTLKKDQQGSFMLLQHIVQAHELYWSTKTRKSIEYLQDNNNSISSRGHENNIIMHSKHLFSENCHLDVQCKSQLAVLLNYERWFSIILHKQVSFYEDYFDHREKCVF
eukprot:TRINITY_DN5746_c0_g2_i1.p1 TRINITY_DN5746_c0_g2~~TRINITY_DN5746_c0_g2_i1.p1  ORF type:complete len:179 (+),score=4.00 TRINITY_DN5746_c0_g2_i1:617-1153(+)